MICITLALHHTFSYVDGRRQCVDIIIFHHLLGQTTTIVITAAYTKKIDIAFSFFITLLLLYVLHIAKALLSCFGFLHLSSTIEQDYICVSFVHLISSGVHTDTNTLDF